MSIPFFSIDMSSKEWRAYLSGLAFSTKVKRHSEVALGQLLKSRYPEHNIVLLPSARLGFYLTLKNAFKPGDEIIFSALSFPLYSKIAIELGLRPVFVDVESRHLNMDAERMESAISSRTKGIVVTNLFGHPAVLSAIGLIAKKYEIPVIEDCAQSFDSNYHGIETGAKSWVGLISCSLMKVPTTLGGGILITKDFNFAEKIRISVEEFSNAGPTNGVIGYHLKGFISVLNSYPWLYSSLSHQVFGLIKKRNPGLLRRILYSGMGMNEQFFDANERPPLAAYQTAVGAVQFARTREMTNIRRQHSAVFDDCFSDHSAVTVLTEEPGIYWNYQYHVVDVGDNLDRVFHYMFSRGIHVMKEDVWDCTAYGFPGAEYADCAVAKRRNRGLLRLPNNSFLSTSRIKGIAQALLDSLN